MRYSLVSRFRGTLFGAALGQLTSWQEQLSPPSQCPWGNLAMQGMESLIAQGRVDVTDWQRLYRELGQTDEPSLRSANFLLAILPVILFCHEYKVKLRHNLQQIHVVWQDEVLPDPVLSQTLQDSSLALGYAIAQALRDKLKPNRLITKTLKYLDADSPSNIVVAQLTQIQQLLETDQGLEQAQTQLLQQIQHLGPTALVSLPLALSFYCFLSTAEDFRLSVKRASLVQHCPELTAALTGALSGAYNSLVGIPLTQRLHFQHPAWGLSSAVQLFERSDRLFCAWSGVYSRPSSLSATLSTTALAAPGTIQPRFAAPPGS